MLNNEQVTHPKTQLGLKTAFQSNIQAVPDTHFPVLQMSFAFGKRTFFSILPLSTLVAGLSYILQPRTIPSFSDGSDWTTFIFFCMGSVLIMILHTSIVIKMNDVLLGRHGNTGIEKIIGSAIYRSGWVLAIGIIYTLLVTVGLLLFILPGIYWAVALYFSSILGVLKHQSVEYHPKIDYRKNPKVVHHHTFQKKLTWLSRIKTSFSESQAIVEGKWWQTFGIFLLFVFSWVGIEQIGMLLLSNQIVLGNLFCILTRIILIPFWYGFVFALIYDKKLKKKFD